MSRSLSSSRLVVAVASLVLAWVAAWGGRPASHLDAAVPQAAADRQRGLYVSVVDADGAPVTDLSPADFIVREDGVRREVLRAERAADPITIALAVDNSSAASPFIADARRALKAFAERMSHGRNPIAVTTFADRPTILQDYTLVAGQVTRGVERIFPQAASGACFLEALRELSNGFARRDFQRGVIVAITGEGPEFSDLHYDQVLPRLRQSGAALHALVVAGRPSPDPRDPAVTNRAAVLDLGPRETGGRQVQLLSGLALEPALQRLADQLLGEYKVTYGRPDSILPPEKIEVGVKRPGLDARGTPIKPTRG